MPELSDRILARSEHEKIPALDRLKMRLKALTAPEDLQSFNDSEILAPGYVRQQNQMAEHVGREKPYGRDPQAEIEFRDGELVEKYRNEQQAKKDAQQPQKLRKARQEYTDEFMAARRKFMRKEKADEKRRKKEAEAKQKTEPPEEPSEAVIREQDRLKKIDDNLRPQPNTGDVPKPSLSSGGDTESPDKKAKGSADPEEKLDDGAKPEATGHGDTPEPKQEPKQEQTDPVDPITDAIQKAFKGRGMLGTDNQIKMVQDILDKAKKSGRIMSIEDAVREMRGEQTPAPSRPGEEEYQEVLQKGAQARQEMREKLAPIFAASASYPNPNESKDPSHANGVETGIYKTFRTKAQLFTEEEKRAWEQQQISPTMQEDPHAVLDPEAEISGYFDRQNPEYLQLLDSYMKQEGMQTPMNDECEAVVCIPVYTLAEGQVIQHALEQYLYQIDPKKNKDAIDPKKFEIILFLNHPATKREELEKKLGKSYREGSEKRVKKGNPEVYDTEEVIQQFMIQHPELPIRVMKEEFEERVLWGQIIKPLYDIALRRAEERDNPTQADPLILTNDIDLVRMSPHYIRDVIDFFRQNDQEAADGKAKRIDGAVGKIDLAPEGYRRVPELLLSKRFHSYLELQNTEYNHATHGRNTILRGSTLASIGGPCPYMDNGADGEMGGQIYYARGGDATTIPYLHKAWLETDPRRELKNLQTGVTLAHNWDTWAEMDIYDKNWTELQGEAFDPEKISKDFLEAEINQTIQHPWYKHHNWGGRVERALSFIGLRNHEFFLNRLIFEKGLSQESDEFVKALATFELTQDDYYWDDMGKLVLKNKDGHVDYHFVEEDGQQKIVIDNIDHVKKKLSDYVEEERWNISQKKVDKVAPEHKEEKTGIQARIEKGLNVIRKLSTRIGKKGKSELEEVPQFPLPSPEVQQASLREAQAEYQQEFQAAQENYQEPQLQAADAAIDHEDGEEEGQEIPANLPESEETDAENEHADEEGDADAAEVETDADQETHPEKPAEPVTDYGQAVSKFIAQNNIELRGPELQRFVLYVKTNNRTDIEQAYDDYLKETAPKIRETVETPEAGGNPLAEAALGMAAMAEQGNRQPKQEPQAQEVTEDMKQILQAGEQNNAEPWYREFLQDTETLKHMEKPGIFRSFSKEQMAQFDRIMTNSLDRMSDMPAYESDSSVLLKSASRNLEFAKAICQRNSPARRLLAEKLEDFIRDDFHAMHYMHKYKKAVNDNALSLFSVTKRDSSFYKGLLAAFFRNKELHPTELANVLGIPEVRDILKQAVLGMEIRSAQ
ncbi:hypothetical protein IPM65_03900 [Candidatus Roizmanbacteria bacterium]|nr:MAG: hypothetical protein IPM65_03900 [Candidatus Roizmanbacteria bacterium]